MQVNRVRNHVADQLRARLAEHDEAAAVVACSMERREGGASATNFLLQHDILRTKLVYS